MGCDFIATGHYAQVLQHDNGRYFIRKGIDDTKDQSYALWGLQQDLLSCRTCCPWHLSQKRDTPDGLRFRIPRTGQKERELRNMLHVPDNDYRGFSNEKWMAWKNGLMVAEFVDKTGKIPANTRAIRSIR